MSLTVLVIDDDPVIVKLLRVNFEIDGFEVISAGDGEEGARMARTEQPDAIVSDIMMPKMNGLELVTTLKSDPATRNLPILLLSAKAQEADVRKGIDLGADGYITKPFDPIDLVDRVNSVVAEARRS